MDSSAPIPTLPLVSRASTPLWRWWIGLFIIGSSPLLAAFSSAHRVADEGAMLPKSVPGLLIFCALQLGAFSVMWVVFWLFSRASQDELFLRWRDGWKTLGWGVGYSILMRLGLVFVAVMVLSVLGMLGFDAMHLMDRLKSDGQGAQKAFSPLLQGDPLYQLLMISLISFVVAGLREELWRVATMAGLWKIAPRHWSANGKNALALGVSSALFGLGHLYQGATGVVGTAFLGIVLGAITLRHRSVWPAIIAHGCFDAVSFAALAMVGKK